MFNGKGAAFNSRSAPIYSFDGRDVLIDPSWLVFKGFFMFAEWKISEL